MKFYRAVVHCSQCGTLLHWESSLRAIDAAVVNIVKEHTAEGIDACHAERGEVRGIDITPTKAGILDALQRFASHNDNG